MPGVLGISGTERLAPWQSAAAGASLKTREWLSNFETLYAMWHGSCLIEELTMTMRSQDR
jgi:hypothetical protein